MKLAMTTLTTNVRAALQRYLDENGFTWEAYEAKWTDASFFGVRFRVPNTKRHAWAIRLHDLHHVATGYGTDLAGEGEISAWELRRGLSGLDAYVSSIVIAGALMGVLVAPRRTLAAWRASGDARGSLFAAVTTREQYESLLAGTVAELRVRLGVPDAGVATGPRRLHAYAPRAPSASVG